MEKANIELAEILPSVSVVIPVKNEVFKIKACLDGILSQSVQVNEIIVIDSGSTDGTLDILRQYPIVRIIEIPSDEFNHGETRNRGVREAKSEFVLFTVGDARPFNDKWIEELLKGFIDDEVVGVCGQQVVPHEKDKNPAEWYHFISEPEIKRYQYSNPADFENLDPARKQEICSWDDVSAIYRRTILLRLPFRNTSFSEDAFWAKDAILSGFGIVYNFHARVFHYHHEDAEFTFRRTFTVLYFRYRLFGFLYEAKRSTLLDHLRLIKILLRNIGLRKEVLNWYMYNITNRRAIRNAIRHFNIAFLNGEEALDYYHQQLCGKPPIPIKR